MIGGLTGNDDVRDLGEDGDAGRGEAEGDAWCSVPRC